MASQEIAEFANILTGVAALIAAIGSATAAILSVRNGRNIERVHAATNGMKEELVKVNGDKMFAEGVKQGEDNPRHRPRRRPVKPKRRPK